MVVVGYRYPVYPRQVVFAEGLDFPALVIVINYRVIPQAAVQVFHFHPAHPSNGNGVIPRLKFSGNDIRKSRSSPVCQGHHTSQRFTPEEICFSGSHPVRPPGGAFCRRPGGPCPLRAADFQKSLIVGAPLFFCLRASSS